MILGLVSSVDAFNIQELDKHTVTYINGKSVITVSIVSSNFVSDNKMKKDLNSINKIVVKVNGKKVNVIKKGKGWQKNKYYPTAIIDRKTIVNGKIKGKNVTILTYTKSNKLIKKSSNIIASTYATTSKKLNKSKYPPYAKLTYNQAFKRVNKNLPKNNYVVYKGYYYMGGDLLWAFDIYEKNVFVCDYSVYDQKNTIEFGSI
ncbi:MAG: hypothetical protein FWH54_03700 [Methanobrevibacter sp.]|nr:hypothetical protein [Methanobrevibacter sp.]